MSQSYVAKPAVVEPFPDPDLPEGWNPLWPFPGVDPPGYSASSPTAFNSDDDDEPVPPRYRVRITLTHDSVDPEGGYSVDTIIQISAHIGVYASPYVPQDITPDGGVNWAWLENDAIHDGDYLEFDRSGAGFSAGGIAGVSGYVDFDNIIQGTSYLTSVYMRSDNNDHQVTITGDLFRTPWVPREGGGYELGEEAQIGVFTRVHSTDGHGVFTPGFLNIWRTNEGLIINEQWATFDGDETTQYLV